ncbi:nitroreductase family protein [Aquimarina gracilis]|uniref:Nitroreductase family protein n=1 Tax=Aquimarina gracilis TaxID=874422 RepID=A0ABU5ZVR2_9FLAO|nr:nitroreductase family protein [Aquimarina gracilis]MEB3345971.1 nitroreductase family protein [Aquimarina gracilis]
MKKMIIKEKDTKFDILPILKERYSPRIFADTPMSELELRTLFEAGRWAPSSYNRQPWRIVWGIKGSETYNRILECLSDFNKSWATNAPALLLNAFKKTTDEGEENFHALHDLGLFMGNVTAQAQHLGIALHQMAGVNYEKAKVEFKFPEEFHIATAVAVGYYGGNKKDLPEDLRDQEDPLNRTRMMQREFTFNGDYMNEPALESSKNGLDTSKEQIMKKINR